MGHSTATADQNDPSKVPISSHVCFSLLISIIGMTCSFFSVHLDVKLVWLALGFDLFRRNSDFIMLLLLFSPRDLGL